MNPDDRQSMRSSTAVNSSTLLSIFSQMFSLAVVVSAVRFTVA
jgi:hypothetical protein